MPRRTRARLLGALTLLLGAACTDGGANVTTTTTVAAVTTTTRPDDGALVVGAVLPTSGSASELGSAMSVGLAVALSEINAAGGINGRPVRLVTREEGSNPATARLAVQELTPFVDAIIGPTSSLDVLSTLGTAVDAGVLTCSPTSTAIALDEFPDKGLFFRTIPSDSVQAEAIASAVEASGSSIAAIVYLDDAYGRPFANAVQTAIERSGTDVAVTVGFTATEESMSAAVDAVMATEAAVVAVIADSSDGPAIINAISAQSGPGFSFVVNDAIRRPASSAQLFARDVAPRIVGVAPVANSGSPQFSAALAEVNPATTGLFAHNAYDCLSIIALAAKTSGSLQPLTMAGAIARVTSSGSACSTYTSCSTALLDGRNINYNGPTGNLSIDENGNVVTANFDRFTFDANGRDIADGSISVGNG